MPLSGIRVLALEGYLAGNIGSMQFVRFGAEVIKLEPPGGGDILRGVGARATRDGQTRSVSELRVMGGKKSIIVDLQKPAGMEVFWRLVAECDVVWTNMKPSSLEKLGITHASLIERNPEIIYTTLSGFGHDDVVSDGPFGDWPAFDLIAQGLAGLQFRAEGVDGQPGYNGLPLGDQVSALNAVLGTVLALLRRRNHGGPQRVDVAMHDAMMSLNELALAMTAFTGKGPARGRSGTSSPYGSYRTADGYMNIAVGGDPIWKRFCKAIGREDLLDDARLATSAGRVTNFPEIDKVVQAWTMRHTSMEATRILHAHGVPCGPVFDLPDVLASPQPPARNMLLSVEDPVAGPSRIVGNPIKIGGVDDTLAPPPVSVGADTAALLTGLLGMSAAEVAGLVAAGAVQTGSA